MAVDLDALTLLRPIRATKWDDVPLAVSSDVEVKAERWEIDRLDFLEVSIRVEPGVAEAAQADLEGSLRRRGVHPAPDQETKTRIVLEHLVGRRS